MAQELVDKVHWSLDAWNRGEIDTWLEAAHPEIEWISELAQRFEGSQTVYRGDAGLRRYWREWHQLWDVAIEIEETFDLGNTVLVLAHVEAHGEASGVALEQPMAYVFEFEDGMARRVRSFFDQQEARAAVGLPRSSGDLP
jgi:ketosteroid isomerase-like protein